MNVARGESVVCKRKISIRDKDFHFESLKYRYCTEVPTSILPLLYNFTSLVLLQTLTICRSEMLSSCQPPSIGVTSYCSASANHSTSLNLTFCGILYLQTMTAIPSCIPHAILERYHSYLIWMGLRLTCNKWNEMEVMLLDF